jgi:3-oxoadipate CoA-transferase alpha subunit
MEEAVSDIFNDAVILVGGFGGPGAAFNVVAAASDAARQQNVTGLVFVVNSPASTMLTWKYVKGVKKLISSFPLPPYTSWRKEPIRDAIVSGDIEVESIPQGTMVERVRAGGAGIPAFYTPVGVGTVVEEGKEKREFNGKPYILEHAIKGDFAFIKADKADRWGNLVYRKSQRNFNPVMATSARITIAEVDEIVEKIDPEAVVTQGIYVQRVVCVPKQTLDFRPVMRRV